MNGPSIEDAVGRLARAFPGAVIWFGYYTRHWWAVAWLCGDWRLIEAATPDGLVHALIDRRYPTRVDPDTGIWRNEPMT